MGTFSDLRPENRNHLNNGEPRMARWDKVDGQGVENLRKVLDLAGEEFLWRPYALDVIENWHLPKYYPAKEMWVSVGPDSDDELQSFLRCLRFSKLVGLLGTIELYFSHRVAMQFGCDQDLPCSMTQPNSNSDIAWKHYMKEIRNVKLYLPCRLSEADVSTKYIKWWKKSLSGLKYASEAASPQKKKAKSIVDDRLVLMANHSPVPPGCPPECNNMDAADPMDEEEDKLTISEFLRKYKKHENVEIIEDGDSEKLSGQVPNLESKIAGEHSFVPRSRTWKASLAMEVLAVALCLGDELWRLKLGLKGLNSCLMS